MDIYVEAPTPAQIHSTSHRFSITLDSLLPSAFLTSPPHCRLAARSSPPAFGSSSAFTATPSPAARPEAHQFLYCPRSPWRAPAHHSLVPSISLSSPLSGTSLTVRNARATFMVS
ncbi:hypothetical protein MSAN_00308000 [Mycena sanguinolenta]|uniref:Uncharacterized protein n=1 Tax=Mycena sanguinolenta TaxID=230812 RepID=A0A8H6ZCA9_9AGAR|nr:hypothetical protein MSAN_00308000 [Mycena sanguinolenta]